MEPLAPTRFSTITGCPHFCASLSATMRGSASAAPPAGKGTITRIARLGYAATGSCAQAGVASKVASPMHDKDLMRPMIGYFSIGSHRRWGMSARRDFLGKLAALGASALLPGELVAQGGGK